MRNSQPSMLAVIEALDEICRSPIMNDVVRLANKWDRIKKGDRYPDLTEATLAPTRCGHVYALALQIAKARAALESADFELPDAVVCSPATFHKGAKLSALLRHLQYRSRNEDYQGSPQSPYRILEEILLFAETHMTGRSQVRERDWLILKANEGLRYRDDAGLPAAPSETPARKKAK
jgi:hypothetical protein